MRSTDWLQLALYMGALALITKPLGLYLVQVLDANGKTWFDPVLRPLERLTYRVMGVKPDREQNWKQYTLAMLLFSLAGCLFTYAILRLQHLLPLNPQGLGSLSLTATNLADILTELERTTPLRVTWRAPPLLLHSSNIWVGFLRAAEWPGQAHFAAAIVSRTRA